MHGRLHSFFGADHASPSRACPQLDTSRRRRRRAGPSRTLRGMVCLRVIAAKLNERWKGVGATAYYLDEQYRNIYFFLYPQQR